MYPIHCVVCKEDEIDFPLHLLASYLRKSAEERGRTGDTAPVLSVPDQIGGGDDEPERMDILNADTALSERPHRHDIKTLK